jgi:prepilin-type N-terminal cleavage/methylation domain-containing protein
MFKNRFFCFWKILNNKKGFTLTELTVTLGVLGIMTAISVPSYIAYLPKHRLQTSTRQIYDDMNLAKIRAVSSNTVTGVDFNTVADTYTVYFDQDGVLGYAPGVDTVIKLNVPLENGVDITVANPCEFNNRGLFTAGPIQVRLTNPTNLIMRVDVNTAGGISILMSKDGGVTWS